ncbi:MAG: hypothetical protein IJP68_12800, partial [Selenomonadaceae bacterium]|nr:hypothetical protein [Selenomonadaceae bacterium]
IYGGQGGGKLLGGDKGDTLVAGSIGTYLNGQDGADSLVGGDGNDTFAYTGGADSISGYTLSQGDLVSVAAGMDVAGASVSTANSNQDLILDFDGEKLTFVGGASSTISLKSGRHDYLFTAESITSGKGVTLTAGYQSADSIFSYGDAYDTINAALVEQGISIRGNDNDNSIIGSASYASSLVGGTGDDTFKGGSAADVFFYTEGKDVIFDFGKGSDSLSIDNPETQISKARASSRRFTLTMTDKKNTLVFRSDDSIPAQISLEGGGYLTKDGVVKDETLKLFSSAKGRIDYGAGVTSINASAVEKQSVTLVGGSEGGTFIFAKDNKKRDGFEYKGNAASISGYESGKDRINLGDYSISAVTVNDNDSLVAISLGSGSTDTGAISLTSAQGSEVMIHQSTSKGNSYQKMVFADTGVLYDKKKATSATLSTGANSFDVQSKDDVKSTLRKIIVGAGVSGISITAGNSKNTIIDASNASGVVSLVSGNKNDKFTGSAYADTFIYKAGKDILQDFDATADQISLSGGADVNLNNAKITANKKSIKFKFGTKDVLTLKPTKGAELSDTLTINGDTRIYGKNSIANGDNVSLTSKFG